MSDNVLRFEATAGTAIAAADSITTLEDLPASPGIRIEAGSRGYLKFGGKCTAFSFDVDARNAAQRVYRLPQASTAHFSTCGGPVYYTVGAAEWV